MSTALVSFNFVTHSVRVVMLNDEPWFVAADVCAALELPNITMALKRLDEDESQVIDFSTLNLSLIHISWKRKAFPSRLRSRPLNGTQPNDFLPR